MVTTYADVKSLVRRAIIGGRYKPNDKLPSDHELAKEFKTSRLTVHRALYELAGEGLVHRSPRRGTLVADPSRHIVGTVAVMIPDFLSSGSRWFYTLSEDLLKFGINSVPYNCLGSVDRALQMARLLVRNPVLGVILAPPTYEDSRAIIDVLRSAGQPVIIEGKFDLPGEAISYVSTNHRQGGRILGEHLASLGHRRFAMISCSHTQDVRERLAGFQSAVVAAGGTVPDDGVFEVRHLPEIRYVVRELMARRDRPAAIFGIHDLVAAEIMVGLEDLGLRVPEDCAVVGMGDEPMSNATLSPMTTVRAPLEQEGRLLASVLLNTLQGRLTEPQRIELDYELVIRKSCGAGLKSG